MTCEAQDLSAYMDGELTASEAASLEAHLETCETCQATLDTLRAFKSQMGTLQAKQEPSQALRARLEALTLEEEPVSGRRWWPLVAVAALVLALAGAWWVTQAVDPLDKAFEDHAQITLASLPLETSVDPTEIRAYFAPRVAHQPVVPSLSQAKLQGGRLCSLKGDKVQLLYYGHRQEALSLYVTTHTLDAPTCQARDNLQGCWVRHEGLTYLLIGESPASTLREMLARL